jgi:hypothetical protein
MAATKAMPSIHDATSSIDRPQSMPNSVPLSDVTSEPANTRERAWLRQVPRIACLDGSTLARALQTLRNQTLVRIRASVPVYRSTPVVNPERKQSFRPQFDTPASLVHDCDLSRVAFRALKSPSFTLAVLAAIRQLTVPWRRIASHLHTACRFWWRPISDDPFVSSRGVSINIRMVDNNIDLIREIADSGEEMTARSLSPGSIFARLSTLS